ncbi:response regulator [Lysobacter psychrotolerans]|uniref:histidine kinase n=2 Tax=Montanilutibacter psychrotolerans TaxID=1327343 RepID=A0A3M8SWW6_9GAMM|nr:response regulator [Lysobacter psychrotolerans]
MAALIRDRDWASTPLGPIEVWPQSLRTAVSICLGSRHPIVLWWGPERWMFYNDAYRPMLGATKHPQFLGASGQACWEEIWDVIGPMMDQVLETGEPTWSEDLFLLMLRYGYLEETYFTFSYSPIRDESGQPVGIFNACTETTARVLSERRMKALREMTIEARSAEEAAQRCADVLADNARDVPFGLVYLLNRAGNRLDLAGRAGLEPGTVAGPACVPMVEFDAATWPLMEVIRSGQPILLIDLAQRFDSLPSAPWGEAPQQAMLVPIARPGSSVPAGVLVLAISPRRIFDDAYRRFFELIANHVAAAVSNARAYEEQRERAEKLAELDRAKTVFFNNVSHEFRTPLTLILSPVADALGDPTKTLQGEALASVHRNALRLLRLVNSLLDFSRIEAGRLTSSFEPTDLSMLTAGLASSFQSLVESVGLKLVVDCAHLPEPIYVDRSQWEKIVLNLISNAFKFTFAGEIVVRLQVTDIDAILTVTDTGTGIPADEMPRIFERFHRIEGARGRSFEGTGIGLALVQELVRQHGGVIHARSVLGKGSTFTVSVPRGAAHLPVDQITAGDHLTFNTVATSDLLEATNWIGEPPSEDAAAPATSPAQAGSGRTDRARLLVADDNADMRDYLVRLLSPRWEVEAVVDGVEALSSALRQPPDLVLSDVMMPRMDGVSLLRALRDDLRTSTVPVVLLSARAGEEAIVAGLETGADDYLVKPFSARELIGRVGTHLELARVRRAATETARVLAETRAALLQDIERKNEELEAFSYSVSHDLRGPLRAIDGFSKILLDEYAPELPADAQDCLRHVCDATRRMGEIINDLLSLSRVSNVELADDAVDMTQLAKKVVSNLRRHDPQRVVDVNIAEGMTTRGDSRLLEIALENLIGNAWKFTSKRDRARIEIGVERQGVESAFFIRDNGAGFDMADAQKLFAPFQRLHSEAQFQGTGIGLTTVHRVISRHRGRIWATGAIDEGATIRFTLASNQPVTTGEHAATMGAHHGAFVT